MSLNRFVYTYHTKKQDSISCSCSIFSIQAQPQVTTSRCRLHQQQQKRSKRRRKKEKKRPDNSIRSLVDKLQGEGTAMVPYDVTIPGSTSNKSNTHSASASAPSASFRDVLGTRDSNATTRNSRLFYLQRISTLQVSQLMVGNKPQVKYGQRRF